MVLWISGLYKKSNTKLQINTNILQTFQSTHTHQNTLSVGLRIG